MIPEVLNHKLRDRRSQPLTTEQRPALRSYPTKVFVETTTECNLGCQMCVKQTEDCGISRGEMTLESFSNLESALPQAEALILNGVGEPLLNRNLEEFIIRARTLMPARSWIGFQSNGILIDDRKATALLAAGLDKICISIDAITPEKLELLRTGAELSDLDRAFHALQKARHRLNKPEFQIGVEIVVMRSNLSELPATLEWAGQHGASFALVTQVLPYDQSHADEAVYEPCSASAIKLFNRWREKAAQENVDIGRYPKLIFNYSKTSDEQQVVRFVEQMKQDAEQQNIYLDLKKLFAMDIGRLDQVYETFSAAKRVAKIQGIDLKLPELLLKDDRRCEFVEDGSVFISWQGDVHPCYFLWHSYNCYASGWRQMVQPRTFGNLNRQPLLDIWTSPEFREFRINVTNYDYPYCSSCGLAPCDYVQTEKFEQDCHINAEPCGSCLWCMGLFQCLR